MTTNPIIHGVVSAILFGISFFLSSNSPILALTVGGILTGLYHLLNNYEA